MAYYINSITTVGTLAHHASPFNSLKEAMDQACTSLQYGARDAWITDLDGKIHADFEAIKKHCVVAETIRIRKLPASGASTGGSSDLAKGIKK